jgi:hypothetical protein
MGKQNKQMTRVGPGIVQVESNPCLFPPAAVSLHAATYREKRKRAASMCSDVAAQATKPLVLAQQLNRAWQSSKPAWKVNGRRRM